MKTTYEILQANVNATDKRRRVQAGWQCPECSGVRVQRAESRFAGASEDRFTCEECGAQWGRL